MRAPAHTCTIPLRGTPTLLFAAHLSHLGHPRPSPPSPTIVRYLLPRVTPSGRTLPLTSFRVKWRMRTWPTVTRARRTFSS